MLTVEQLSQMTMPQLLAEEKARYEQVAVFDQKYPTGLTQFDNAEDHVEYKKLLDEVDQMSGYIGAKQSAQQQRDHNLKRVDMLRRPAQGHEQPGVEVGESGDGPKSITMFGQQFVNDEGYQKLAKSGALLNPGVRHQFDIELKGSLLAYLAHKALVYSASGQGGNLIQNDRLPGMIDILQRQLTLLDLLPTSQTTSNLIEYVSEKTNNNNSAPVAEATVTTIAEWIPVTNAMLADAPQIRGLIDNRLIYHLNQTLENQILSGDGNSPNLLGILATPNIQTLGLAAGATYGGAATVVDAAYAAMVQVQVTGLAMPNAFVFNPIDWAAVRLSRESAVTGNVNPGGYLYGPPSVAGPMTLWGRPVVEALGMTQNTMLTGDFQLGCSLYDREQAAIRVGTINDQFTRNMQTILAELRAAFVVFRPTAFARVTGV